MIGRVLCWLGWHRWEPWDDKALCCSRDDCLAWRIHPDYKRRRR